MPAFLSRQRLRNKMPKRPDPSLMELTQREQDRLRQSPKRGVSPRAGLKKQVKVPNPEGLGRRGLPR